LGLRNTRENKVRGSERSKGVNRKEWGIILFMNKVYSMRNKGKDVLQTNDELRGLVQSLKRSPP
jgi:hypothetical protein